MTSISSSNDESFLEGKPSGILKHMVINILQALTSSTRLQIGVNFGKISQSLDLFE